MFGCAGVLANDPVRCAALNRHVAGLPAADQQDPARFHPAPASSAAVALPSSASGTPSTWKSTTAS